MPDPFSANSVSRVSNWAVRPMYSMISSGIPRSASTVRRSLRTAGSFIAIDRLPLGSAWIRRLSIRIASWGA